MTEVYDIYIAFVAGLVCGLAAWHFVKRAAFKLWALRMRYKHRHLKQWTGQIAWVPEELTSDELAQKIRDNLTSIDISAVRPGSGLIFAKRDSLGGDGWTNLNIFIETSKDDEPHD